MCFLRTRIFLLLSIVQWLNLGIVTSCNTVIYCEVSSQPSPAVQMSLLPFSSACSTDPIQKALHLIILFPVFSNLEQFLSISLPFKTLRFWRMGQLSTPWNAPRSGFVWNCLVLRSRLCIFGRKSERGCRAPHRVPVTAGGEPWGLVSGDVNFDHFVKVVSSGFLHPEVTFLPYDE